MIDHLKDRAYYENIYDHGTIRELKGLESIWKKAKKEGTPDVSELLILFTKMDRYEYREEWIEKIMEKDRRRDEFQNNTKPCSDIVRCKLCNERIEYHYKNFDENYETWKFRMLFLYRCDSCKQWRWIYNTWEEFVWPKEKCKNCWKVAEYSGKFEWDTLIKTISCESCNETYIEEEDFTTTKIKEDPITQKI